MIEIKHPEWLHVEKNKHIYYGYDQEWYRNFWRRKAGCGPTCATMHLTYLNRRNQLSMPYTNDNYDQVVASMNNVWHYITPGLHGLNTLELFENGYLKIAGKYKLLLTPHKLDMKLEQLPSIDTVTDFIAEAIRQDTPVAFLNWHNGDIPVLDSWHWVLIIGIDECTVICYDQGQRISFDIGKWLEKTEKGGGLIYLS